MKHICKRVLPFLLAATLFLPAVGCAGDGAVESGTETEPESGDEGMPAAVKTLTIGGRPLSDFSIVYAESGIPKPSQFAIKRGQESEFNKITAERLRQELEQRTGVRLSVRSDASPTQECEILVGGAKREAVDALVVEGTDRYTVAMSGDSLCFLGGAYGTTYHSVDRFLDYLDGQDGDWEIPADFWLEGEHHLTVVGCIGDSITFGVGTTDAANAYPAALNRILWRDCVVVNYGVGGMTMRGDTWASYLQCVKYTEALQDCPGVDVFTIMLGTNDSRPDIVESYGVDWEQFEKGFTDLLSSLQEKNANVRFILMNCPVYYGDSTYAADYILEWQERLYETYRETYALSFYDMRAFSEANMPETCFGDLLHPNDAGYAIMAQGVADMLREYLGLS